MEFEATFMSSSNILCVVIKQSESYIQYAFKITWKRIPKTSKDKLINSNAPNCGDTDNTIIISDYNIHTLSSPGYPNGFENDLICSWIISTNLILYHTHLIFVHLDLEYTHECINNYIELFKSSDMINWVSLGKYCSIQMINNQFSGNPFLKISFKTNSPSSRSGFLAQMIIKCGSTLRGPSGIIKYDYNITNTQSLDKCIWIIQVKQGKMIEFNFEKIDIDCAITRTVLQIKNGIYSDSPILGGKNICGTNANNISIPITSGNMAQVSIEFYITNFTLSYQETGIDCTQRIILSESNNHVFITSPKYPNLPDPFSECNWIISTKAGENLQYEIIEQSTDVNCDDEYMELKYGISDIVYRHCGIRFAQYETDIVEFDAFNIEYLNNLENPKYKFKLKVSIAQCGGVYHLDRGTIEFSKKNLRFFNSPRHYLECTFSIIGTRNIAKYVSLSVQNMSLSSSDEIKLDYTPVQSSRSKFNIRHHSFPLFFFLRNETNRSFIGDRIFITFNTTVPINDTTFWKINYTIKYDICTQTYQKPSDSIQSIGYPYSIRHGDCEYLIEVPVGRRVKIEFRDVDISGDLYIMENNIMIKTIMSSDTVYNLRPIYSTSNKIMIIYSSFSLSNHRGFIIQYTSDLISPCTGDLNQLVGTVEITENLEKFYCEFKRDIGSFYADKPNVGTMVMEFNKLTSNDLISNKDCKYNVQYSEFDVSICIEQLKYQILSIPSSRITFTFSQSHADPFNILPRINYIVHKCGGIIQLDYQNIITLPQIETINYGKIDCAWIINAGENEVININITKLAFTLSQTSEYIRLYQGPSPTHLLLGEYKKDKNDNRLTLITTKNQLLIEYHSDNYNNHTEFDINVEPTSFMCGGILTEHSHHFASPKVNSSYTKYPDNTECEWEIHTMEGFHIGLQFIGYFSIEFSTFCAKDYLEIYDWRDEDWISIARICGRDISRTYNSTGSKMRVSN